MKKLWLVIVLLVVFSQLVTAQPKPQNTDTVWTKYLSDEIRKVKFTPDSNNVAVALDSCVRFYDISTGNLTKEFYGGMLGLMDFQFSDDGQSLLTTSVLGKMKLWNINNPDSVKTVFQTSFFKIGYISENLIMGLPGGADSNNIKIVDINTGIVLNSLGASGYITTMAISRINNLFAVGSCIPGKNNNVELWDLNTKQKIKVLGSHSNNIKDLAFSADGKLLASASEDRTIKIWDINSKLLLKTIIHDSISSSFVSIKFSSDNKYFISSGGGGNEFTTKTWDVETFNNNYKYPTPFGASSSLDVSNDLKYIFLGMGPTVILLNAHWTPTGINDLLSDHLKIIYPNPSGNEITIPFEPLLIPLSISFINTAGVVLKTITNIGQGISNINVDISMLPVGSYFVRVDYNNKSVFFKFEKIL